MTNTKASQPQGHMLGYSLGEILGHGQIKTEPIGYDLKQKSPSVSEVTTGELPFLFAPPEGHGMVIAGTGAGKSRSVAIPLLLTSDNPMVVLDVKGELYPVTAEHRRKMGHEVIRIDFTQLLGPGANRFNFLDVFKHLTPSSEIDTESQSLAEMMSFEKSGLDEGFWDAGGISLNRGVLTSMISLRPAPEWTLRNFLALMFADDLKYSLAALLDANGKDIPAMAYQDITSFLQLPDVTAGGVAATAQSYLKSLMSESVLNATDSSDFSLLDVRDGKPMTIYIVFPPEKLQSHRALLRVWIGSLLKAITSRRTIPGKRTIFLLDEAAQLGTFNYLQTIMTLCRGYGVSCVTLWQDLQQIKSRYNDWQTLVNNCSVLQFFGCKNHLVAKGVEEITGIAAHRIAALPEDQQLVVINGKNYLSQRFDYLTDKMFQGLYKPNPFYQQSEPPKKGKNKPVR